jgi:hypothetical protein
MVDKLSPASDNFFSLVMFNIAAPLIEYTKKQQAKLMKFMEELHFSMVTTV